MIDRPDGDLLAVPPASAVPAADAAGDATRHKSRKRRWYAFSNIGAVYVWGLVIVFFSIIAADTFPKIETAKLVLNDQAVTGLIALCLILPLAAGVYDLSVGYTLGTTSMVASRLLAETSMSPTSVVLLSLLVGLAIGIGNGIVVVTFKIDSFIGTLATSSLLGALITIVSENRTISSTRLLGSFSNIARADVWGITAPVFYMLGLGLIVWFVLEHTSTGRYLYAIGYGPETARLSGIRTERLRFLSLVFSGLFAGFAGIVLTARVTTGSPTIGPPYLLPAFAAAFVGATQLRGGRFNAWGTVIAVLLIGTGTAGLSLAGTPIWAPSVFVGVTLIIAIALTKVQGRTKK